MHCGKMLAGLKSRLAVTEDELKKTAATESRYYSPCSGSRQESKLRDYFCFLDACQ